MGYIKFFIKVFISAVFAGFVCGVMVSPVFAQSDADRQAAERQADTFQRQAQERAQHDLDAVIDRNKQPQGVNVDDLAPKIRVPAMSQICFDIASLRIEDAPNLSSRARQDITVRFVGRCLGVTEIEQILGEITRDYIRRGFISARVYLPAQDLKQGVLTVAVLEGMIESVELQDHGKNSVFVGGAFPGGGQGVLNLRDLEQGIDNINRLSSNAATLEIKPGEAAGMSRVVIKNEPKTPFHASLGFDNTGFSTTGREQASATVSADRWLGLNELLLFSHRQSLGSGSDRRLSESDNASVIIPLGYSTVSLSLGRSRYVSTIQTASGALLKSSGDSQFDTWKFDRVLFRDQDTRLSMSGSLTMKSSKNYLAGQFLSVNSRDLSVFDWDHSLTTPMLGGVVTLELGYAKGLDFAGALKDLPGLTDATPRAQFGKYKYGYHYVTGMSLGGVNVGFSSQLVGQKAIDTLYGSEQMLIGGLYSVRGFSKNTLSGDHGYYVRNEISIRPGVSFGSVNVPVRFFAGYDFGEVKNRAVGALDGKLSGVVVGCSSEWAGWRVELSNARPLKMPSYFNRESSQSWIRLNYSI